MHERYFYLAEVLTVIAVFHLPRRLWYVPILVQVASSLAYAKFLFPATTIPADMLQRLPPLRPGQGPPQLRQLGGNSAAMYPPTVEFRILAGLMAVAVIVVLWTTIRELRLGITTHRQFHSHVRATAGGRVGEPD
jgi:hypothetical protein